MYTVPLRHHHHERSGDQLRRILCKKNPFSDIKCQRSDTCMICKEGGKGECRRRNNSYILTCDLCMAKSKAGGGDNNNAGDGDTTPPDATATAAVASYGGETARSGAERSEDHVQDLKAKSEHSAMYKHKLLAHPEEEVTFTMRIQRRHQGPLSRMVHENVIIEMLEAAGTSINSKVGGYNRCSMPRLSVVVNDKLHEPQPQEAAVEDPELDVEGIFNNNNRRKKKKSRDKSDHDSEVVSAPISLHLPPPKRRKIIRTKLCTSEDIPEEELGPGQA